MIRLILIGLILTGLVSIGSTQTALPDSATRYGAIRQVIQQEIALHPQATLVDLYKFFFQDAYGPGHMIPSQKIAENILQQELAAATEYDSVLIQPVGFRTRYYRLNLRLVRDNLISADSLLTMFIDSANQADEPNIKSWEKEWAEILQIIGELYPSLCDSEVDRQKIETALTAGQPALHHSTIYSTRYHPHYRVVRADFVKNHPLLYRLIP